MWENPCRYGINEPFSFAVLRNRGMTRRTGRWSRKMMYKSLLDAIDEPLERKFPT